MANCLCKQNSNQSLRAVTRFKNYKMIVNPGKSQAIILDNIVWTPLLKRGSKFQLPPPEGGGESEKLKKGGRSMVQGQVFSGTPLQTMDKKSNHKQEIIKIANQLNALIKIKKFVGFEEKKVLINSYFHSNFNYCPLFQIFSHAGSLKYNLRLFSKMTTVL